MYINIINGINKQGKWCVMSPKRSKIRDIIAGLFEDLGKSGEKTITDMVKNTGYNHRTVLNYLEIIELIQSKPKLLLKRTGHSYLASLES